MSSNPTDPTPASATTATTDGGAAGQSDLVDSTGINDGSGSPGGGAAEEETLTLRALITSRDAGVIIGKAGKNVADLRESAGVKAGVSKVAQSPNGGPPVGAQERVLTVTGPLEGVSKAYHLVAQSMLENPPLPVDGTTAAPATTKAIRFLVSHNLMGSIIGKEGKKIKEIQDKSGARVVAHKDMLPQSTERVVEVSGTPESLNQAVLLIGRCLIDDWERGQGTVLYHPSSDGLGYGGGYGQGGAQGYGGGPGRRTSGGYGQGGGYAGPGQGRRVSNGDYRNGGGEPSSPTNRRSNNSFHSTNLAAAGASSSQPVPTPSDPSLRTQNISIPSDMVGCIIGKGGTKISEIRRLSGSKISIAKTPHDETGERMFTITGTPEANEKALYLLYSSLESEKERRVRDSAQEEES